MRVNVTDQNPALVSLINDYTQQIPLDANFFISFDRSNTVRGSSAIPFKSFQKFWLDPLFLTFPYLSIHRVVFNELVSSDSRNYALSRIDQGHLIVMEDSEFEPDKEIYRQSFEKAIAAHTAYEPELDNADDRGEVKSLAYIATKPLNFFASHDSRALRLLESPTKETIGLANVGAIEIYELLYYLRRMEMVEPEDGVNGLKMIYKYLYYLTKKEKQDNPQWGEFYQLMDGLYASEIQKSTGKPIPYRSS
ncbi:hypothetical protein [Paenibacillus lutimineralis]|uniref:Uncharacterized protein n=1 Tax=Paenibacillus lutimineralis TaxID=2707005 RepID=A0A3S9USD4_9BACL|nr:hypothetical protein [Paenibacillus lutimineralis]AZS13229.1 hypothetical protein EI981_01165 [Paenibacillus lutimineralis]